MAYDLNNPHPEFGKDPNIVNEFGHTAYPRFVEVVDDTCAKTKDGKPIPNRVLVNNKKEEEEVSNKKPAEDKKGSKDWKF